MNQLLSLNLHLAVFCSTLFSNLVLSDPSCSGSSSDGRTIGYYEGWNLQRPCETMTPSQIPLGYYTHINFAFAVIDPTTFGIADLAQGISPLYDQVTALKQRQEGLQVWISIGGSSFTSSGPTQTTFSNLAASESDQASFFASLIAFMKAHQFDGLDIDWEYPVAAGYGGSSADYANFVTFLQNLRNALDGAGFASRPGLSVAIPYSSNNLQGFDLAAIEPIVDWFNFMTYDMAGIWDNDGIESHTNLTVIEESLAVLWNQNIDPSKVSLGLAFYGHSFTLSDPRCVTAGCPFTSGGTPGPCTQTSGMLSAIEIETEIANGATVSFNSAAAAEIVTFDTNQWVSYDDAKSLTVKQQYANAHCLGGTFVWAVDLDNGELIDALGSGMSRPKATVTG